MNNHIYQICTQQLHVFVTVKCVGYVLFNEQNVEVKPLITYNRQNIQKTLQSEFT